MPVDFTQFLDSPLRQHTRKAVAVWRARQQPSDPQAGHVPAEQSAPGDLEAAHRLADFDPPTAADFETLDVCDALCRLLDRVDGDRLRQLLYFMECARGQR